MLLTLLRSQTNRVTGPAQPLSAAAPAIPAAYAAMTAPVAGAPASPTNHKALDFVLVIAGWPVAYSVAQAYALPASGDVSTANGFTAVRPWMNAPRGAAAKVKARPEEGQMTVGQLDLEVLDKQALGVRSITDLVSRRAYLEKNAAGVTTNLSAVIGRTDTTIPVLSTAGFTPGQVVHISQEAIKVGGVTSTSFVNCTRGYLLTETSVHGAVLAGNTFLPKVYGFMPSLYRRMAFLYKGYQSLPLDSWTRSGYGPIANEGKKDAVVNLTILSQTWEIYRPGPVVNPWGTGGAPAGGTTTDPLLNGDTTAVGINVVNGTDPRPFAKGHWFAVVGGEMVRIRGER